MSRGQKVPSDRSFGVTFSVVLLLVGAWMAWRTSPYAFVAIGLGFAFGALGLLKPSLLHPLNVVWMRFGLLLNRIVSPIVLGAIYLLLFVPVGLYFRLRKRDVLRRAWEPERTTYWIDRLPPGPEPHTFPRQF
jgi:hypothetical protein